jgi:CRISPR-associated protein Cmr2
LDEIGETAEPQGYIGIIYADGNRMGDHLQQLETLRELQAFSATVDKAVKQALTMALLRRYTVTQTKVKWLPVLIPLCGGDDLVVIVPGHDALGVAVDYLQEFQNRVRGSLPEVVAQRIGGREMSACAGVAIAKAHTPLVSLFDLAHELCQSAKTRSYAYARPLPGQASQEVPCLDFQMVTTPSWKNVKEVRTTEYVLDDRTRLTARPYTVEEVRRLLRAVQALKREKFPPGKLYDLYRGLQVGKGQAVLRYLTLLMRAQESPTGYKQRTALKEAAALLGVSPDSSLETPLPPWQPWSGPERGPDWLQTPYGDMVEIYAFVQD